MSYRPDKDVIAVQRGPDAGGLGGVVRTFGETLRGLKTTFGRLVEGPVTIQYPEEKTPVYPRFRGRHKLHRFEDTELEKCVGCSLCVAACPADCIRVVAAENTPDHRVSAGERYAEVYEINMTRCIFCGYCEVACPFDAITLGHDYEMSDYNRSDLIFTKEMLLADPVERTPLRREGESSDQPAMESAVVFWFAAVLAVAGALGVVLQRNPFYSVLALVVHLIALAVLFLLLRAEFLAAAQVIVYAGAVMVLYVFVVAYVGGLEDPLTEPTPALRVLRRRVRGRAAGRAERRDHRLGPEGARHPRRRPRGGLRLTVADRRAVPDEVPDRVRARVAAAADRRGRSDRPRRPRTRNRPTICSRSPGRRDPRWTSSGTSSSRR